MHINPSYSNLSPFDFKKTEMFDFNRLELEFAVQLEDPMKAGVIVNNYQDAYDELIAIWPDFGSDEFIQFLKDSAKLLGSKSVDLVDQLPKPLLGSIHIDGRSSKRLELLSKFFSNLKTEWGQSWHDAISQAKLKQIDRKTTIVVLSRLQCGRGHWSAAESITEFLKQRNYNVHLVDTAEDEKGVITIAYDGKPYGCNTTMEDIRARIVPLLPDVIINTVAHHNKWSQISYDISTPMLVVHTDYQIHDAVTQHDGVAPNPLQTDFSGLVKYGLTDERDYYGSVKGTSREHFQSMVVQIGFPVRPAFVRETASVPLRADLGIKPEERVVLMLGHSDLDGPAVHGLVRQILESDTPSFPTRVVVVCGKSEERKDAIHELIKQLPPKEGLHIDVLGFVSAEKMADYMKVVSRVSPFPGVMISKTGGSTTSEALALGVYTIALDVKPEEACNREFMIEKGLAELANPLNFVHQLQQALSWSGTPEEVYSPVLDWKGNLERFIGDTLAH